MTLAEAAAVGRGPRMSYARRRQAVSAELSFVAACLAWPRTPERARRVRATAAAGLDWADVAALVRRHRVAGLVQHSMTHAQVVADPPVDGLLSKAAQMTAFEELRLAAELSRLTGSAQDLAPPTVLKGVAAALQGYGRIGLRQNRDIDLLVRPVDVAAWRRQLESDGYEPVEPVGLLSPQALQDRMRTHKDIVYRHRAHLVVVELHWRLFDNRELDEPIRLGPRSQLRLPTGRMVQVLPVKEAFLYMAAHGAQHAWSRLKWLADFAAYAEALGPHIVQDLHLQARGSGLGRAMAQGLILSSELMGTHRPGSVTEELRASWRLKWLVRLSRQAIGLTQAVELEDRIFGSTLKTVSHYLLGDDVRFLIKQAASDIFEVPEAQASPLARRLGPVAKIPFWIIHRGRLAFRGLGRKL